MLYDKFLKMEEEYELYQLKESNIPQLWDVLRLNIYKSYYAQNETSACTVEKKKRLTYIFCRVREIVKSEIYWYSKTGIKSLVAPHSRNVVDGVYYDKVCKNVIDTLGEHALILEDHCSDIQYMYGSFYPFIYIKYLTWKYRNYSISDSNYKVIVEALRSSFQHVNITKSIVNATLRDFLLSRDLFGYIFKHKQIDCLYYIYVGNIKGAIAACRKYNVKSVDLQHCIIEEDHPVYSYPSIIRPNNNKVLMPDCLFTFGPYWGKNVNIPVPEIIVSGNDEYCHHTKKINVNPDMMIISNSLHKIILMPIITEYAKEHPKAKIMYKLHRDEYSSIDEYKNYFLNTRNVEVITNEYPIQDLLGETKVVLLAATAVMSTCLYETLYYNKNAVIIKPQRDEGLPFLYHCPNVYVSDGTDFSDVINSALLTPPLEGVGELFFQPFNKEIIKL